MSLLPEVESVLLDAVRRDQQARARGGIPHTVRGWLRGRPRGLLLAAGLLVISGTAAAAITLSVERSAPLSGVVAPYKAGGSTLSFGGLRYWLAGIEPSIDPGSIGWCETYWVQGTVQLGAGKTLPHFGQGSGSCGGTAAVGSPIFAADGSGGRGLHFFLTGPNVAAVRIANTLTVLTRTDARLPFGFRAAVFNLPSGTKLESVPVAAGAIAALDASGHKIPGGVSGRPPALPTAYWNRPHPEPHGSCALHATPDSGLVALGGMVVTSIVGDPGIVGRAFLPCIAVAFAAQHTLLEAAVLLDAHHPGVVPAPLPGVHPVPGDPGLFDWPNPDGLPGGFRPMPAASFRVSPLLVAAFRDDVDGLSATRVGNAWLVVEGGTGIAQRLAALRHLTIGHINLHPAQVPLPAPLGSKCWIGYHPLPGLVEVSEQPPLLLRLRPRLMPSSTCTVIANFYYERWPIAIQLSVGRPYVELHAARPINGHPTLFTVTTALDEPRALLKHIGNTWLLVSGSSGLEQQETVLAALNVYRGRR